MAAAFFWALVGPSGVGWNTLRKDLKMYGKNYNNVENKKIHVFLNVNKNYVLCMRTPNQDPNTQGPQRVSNNNQQITHQISTKGRWNELQDTYFTASKENIALSPDKNFLELSCTIRYSSNFQEGKLRRRSDVELFRRQTKLSELSSWKIRHPAHLSSSEWVVIVQRVLPVCFRKMDMLWFSFVLGLNFIFFCFWVW